MKRTVAMLIALIVVAPAVLGVRADEGMWTFDNVPRALIKQKYGFEITDQWLEHVRLASARVGNGGSGSFVSPDGLLFTNQHVGRGQVAKLSTPERDLVKNGFYAPTRAGRTEVPGPRGEHPRVVRGRHQARAGRGEGRRDATPTRAAQRRAEMAAIEKECSAATGLKCEVITLYSGGEYWLYRNKKYTDLRLVFAPEEQIAYFGGDYDNFTYPRWNFDITFFRAYENGEPAKTTHYLKWSKARRGRRRADLHAGLSRLDRAAADGGADQVPARRRQPRPDAGVDVAARRARAVRGARAPSRRGARRRAGSASRTRSSASSASRTAC